MQHREYSHDKIIRSIESVLSRRDINYLTHEAYTFIHLHCGSIAHYSLEGWKSTYRDLRDFINFFLVKNEYSACLADPPSFMNLTIENRQIILAIVDVCKRYRQEITDEINNREREVSFEIAKMLQSGELSLRDLLCNIQDVEQLVHNTREKRPTRLIHQLFPKSSEQRGTKKSN